MGTEYKLPSITIVTPSYNQAQYLETTLRSVIEQNYPRLEYFVMDGGSDDGSEKLIQKYSENITYWQFQKDGGQSDAIREGFGRGSGDILGWINSDDAFFPGALNTVGEYFAAYPETDILLCGIAYADMNSYITRCYTYPKPRQYFARSYVMAFGQQGMFFRRDTYERFGGLREDFHYLMDAEFLYKLFLSGAQIGTSRSLVGIFRWHDDMKSINRLGRKAEEGEILRDEYKLTQKNKWYVSKLFQLEQAFNGNYLYSALQTMRHRGATIDSIWAAHPKNH